MEEFSKRKVAVTLTGAQWTALLARITYSKPKAELFSPEGARIYRTATEALQKQLLAESDRK